MNRLSAFTIAALIGGCAAAPLAWAQDYPSRVITIVVPFPAGGPSDILARILAERMKMSLGQSLIIENVGGAGGSIGVGRAARTAPDGYTLSIGNWGTHVVNGAIYPLRYDLLKDFEPVAFLSSNPQLIVAKNAVPAKNLQELIAWLKANQDKVSAGTGGIGTPSHIIGIYFQNNTGTHFQFVPYRGGAAPVQAVVAGEVDLMFAQSSDVLPHVQSGRMKAYALMAKARLASAPDIPTVDEAGLPAFHMSVWFGLWAPRGTPKEVIAKLNAAVVDALANPAVRQRLTGLGMEIPPREQQTPEALRAHHKAEIDKWWPVIKAANIRVE